MLRSNGREPGRRFRSGAFAANVNVNVAKVAGEAHLILEADVLLAKENHAVLQKRVVNLRALAVAQRLGQIDAADFRANVGRARRDYDFLRAHVGVSRLVISV